MQLFTDQGFLLTRQCVDRPNGLDVILWLKTENGPVKLVITNELAIFFVEQAAIEQARHCLQTHGISVAKIQPLALKTFDQQPVSGVYFNTLKQFYLARELLKQQHIKCYEDDIRPDDRFLMERFITAGVAFSGTRSTTAAQEKSAYFQVSNARCKPVKSTVALSVLSIDIECALDGTLYSIAAYSECCQQVFMIGAPEPDAAAHLVWVEHEQPLLQQFIGWLKQVDPDILIGWNVINFDLQLLQTRCDLYGIAFDIGRDGSTVHWRSNKSTEQKYLEIAGRVVLDGIDLLKTATYSFASFSLDHVANALLGIGKKVTDVDNRVQEISDNFHHNKQALAAYNLEDCRLVWLIFEKTLLLDFAMLRAQLTGLAIDRVGGSVAAFTNLYLPKLHRHGYIAPNMGDGHSGLVSPGGFVMDSIPGLYDNVLVLDFKSLYPSIIRTFKIDPMGLIEGLLTPEVSIAAYDGACFSREQHFLPAIIEALWQERDKAKADKNAALSQAIKIIMNSFYGVLGSTGCRFFDPRLSGAITKRSHEILKVTSSWIQALGYQVIYGDTDSIFVHVGSNHSSAQSQAIGVELQQLINNKWQEKINEEFALPSALEIEFETHFSRFFMPAIRGQKASGAITTISATGTKKRYAGLVVKNNQQHIVFKGLETVRSDWTELSKIFQQELYRRVFNNEPVQDYIRDIVSKTLNGEYDELLVYRKRLRRKLALYVKNVPPQVKAARMADQLNAAQGKALKYQNRGWIEYFITRNGPEAKEYCQSPLDYDFYVDRQLKAVADDILPFIHTSFAGIVDHQLGMFS